MSFVEITMLFKNLRGILFYFYHLSYDSRLQIRQGERKLKNDFSYHDLLISFK